MRVYLEFEFDNLVLPIHYNHILQSIIIKLIDSSKYRRFIHDEGFTYGKRKFKLYTFSRLLGNFEILDHKIKFYNRASLIVSSLDDNMINHISNYIMNNRYLKLLGKEIFIKQAILTYLGPTETLKISTKSPLVVYSTMYTYDKKKKTIYHSPDSADFIRLLKDNVYKKYVAFYGDSVKGDLEIKHVGKTPKKVKVIYKNTVIFGWMTAFDVFGNYELLRVIYDSGLGMKNSMGFGCMDLIQK